MITHLNKTLSLRTIFSLLLALILLLPESVGADCIDPDGDGYGWNGDRACRTRRVRKASTENTLTILNHQVSEVRDTSVKITANFSEKSSGRIEFGDSASLGKTGPYTILKQKGFVQTLKGLKPNTTYHYRVMAQNGRKKAYSKTGQFKTSAKDSLVATTTTTSSTTTKPKPTTTTKPKVTSASTNFDGVINVASAWQEGDFAFVVQQDFGVPGDSSANGNVSTLRIFEDGRELNMAHASHQSIRMQGKGRFSHWGQNLYFSASDNSNPSKNRRSYTFIRGNGVTTTKPQGNTGASTSVPPATPPTTPSAVNNSGNGSQNNILVENCPFPSVRIENSAVSAGIFGPVPRINGRLPAEMPIGVPFDGIIPGTEYIRISSNSGNGGHYYSSRQVWNADKTKLMIGDGLVDENRLLDATNGYSLLPQRINLNSNRVWSNVDPDIIYGLSGNTLFKVNVSTGSREPIYTRPNGAVLDLRGKATIPDDDSKMLLYVPSENKLVSINLQSNQVPRPVLGELDWTPYGSLKSGGMFLNYGHAGRYALLRTPVNGKLYRLSPDLTQVNELGSMCCHSDNALNIFGESVEAETIWSGRLRVHNYDTLSSYKTPSTIEKLPGLSSMFPSYVSGRGQKQCGKGWVVMSGEEGEGSPNHPLIVMKIDGNSQTPTFKAVGGDLHSGAAVSNIYINAGKQKAVQSPDGSAIIFDSDGGVPGGELSTYILRDRVASR